MKIMKILIIIVIIWFGILCSYLSYCLNKYSEPEPVIGETYFYIRNQDNPFEIHDSVTIEIINVSGDYFQYKYNDGDKLYSKRKYWLKLYTKLK
jgi:hypothetical protein